MDTDLENNLTSFFPKLFDNRNKAFNESPMSFGIECGDGWYDLIYSVCWEIKQHEDHIIAQTKWKQERDPNYQSEYRGVKFDQIKEKFGGLRIYFSGGDDRVRGIISLAETISFKLCEICGNKGQPSKSGWITTLCDLHRSKK